MSRSPVVAHAESVRDAIRADVNEGLLALLDFANANAVTPRLKHEALLLKFNQREMGPADLDGVRKRMLDLVGRIEKDHETHWDRSEADALDQRLSEIQTQYLKGPPLTNPAFIGQGLGKRYRGFRLDGVDLTLRPGEVTAVVGQNANGKTTLLRIVAGVLRADEGTLEYPLLSTGKTLDWATIKTHIAYLPQELPPWPGVLRDSLHYEAALHGILGQDNEREVAFISERLGLSEHLDKRWAQLSGGYRLRFALARVLIWKPRLLVLDEPLANLDVIAQSRLLQDLVDLARSPRYPLAVLMSSQHLHELQAVASWFTFLRDGHVVFNGPVDEIGSSRTYNVYELTTPASATLLKDLFHDPRYEEPSHDGVSYTIKTGIDVDAHAVLRKLMDAGVEVTYFRDVSRSIKRLFE